MVSASDMNYSHANMEIVNSQLYRRGAIRDHVPYLLVIRYYWKSLIGTCGTWFLYDFVTIPNAVFSGTVIASVVPDGDVKGTAEWQLLLGSIALPGVILGAFMLDWIGRKRIMMVCGLLLLYLSLLAKFLTLN